MGTLPLPKCRIPTCTERTVQRGRSLCPKCQREEYKQRSEYESDPFYWTPEWRKTRARQLRKQPFCEECERGNKVTKANVVDHIIPRRQGGADFAEDNLQSMCSDHHQKKRRQERGGKIAAASISEDGTGRGSIGPSNPFTKDF